MNRIAPSAIMVVLLVAGFVPDHSYAQDAEVGTAKLVGKVVGPDGKRPVEGAKVLAYHLSSERLFASEPTGGKATYEIAGLPYGYYDLAVETPEGLFVGEHVINLAPATKAVVTLSVNRTEDLPLPSRSAVRPYPGSELEPIGLALGQAKATGREFWRSPKGIALLGGVGGAALLAIAAGADDDPDVSPVTN